MYILFMCVLLCAANLVPGSCCLVYCRRFCRSIIGGPGDDVCRSHAPSHLPANTVRYVSPFCPHPSYTTLNTLSYTPLIPPSHAFSLMPNLIKSSTQVVISARNMVEEPNTPSHTRSITSSHTPLIPPSHSHPLMHILSMNTQPN